MIRSFYLNNIVYYIAGSSSVMYVLSFFEPALFRIAGLILLLLLAAIVVDILLVYTIRGGLL
jgi:hypothetical protein